MTDDNKTRGVDTDIHDKPHPGLGSGVLDLEVHRGNELLTKIRQMQDNVEQLKKQAHVIKAFNEINAELKYAKYSALCAAGFSETQALELCKGDSFL